MVIGKRRRAIPNAVPDVVSAIARSPISTVVTDPRRPDNPIIGTNDAFTLLTGYTASEAVGQNCRFLAGCAQNTSASVELGEAVRAREAVFAELVNYKKDGTKFLNAIMVAPVLDDDGGLLYFVGSQMDISNGGSKSKRCARASRLIGRLTRRQLDVLSLMVRGQRNKQIAVQLSIHEKTVKMHRAALRLNLGAATSADAIRIGVEAGL